MKFLDSLDSLDDDSANRFAIHFNLSGTDGDLIRQFNMVLWKSESGDGSLMLLHIMCINKACIEIIIQSVVNLIMEIEIFVDRYYKHRF